ncbi:hypothetical protein PM082_004413 [Marasmius tenuissimus]|nr:hypothetical protein PM082_004413 [Marasmius tenuissimus]
MDSSRARQRVKPSLKSSLSPKSARFSAHGRRARFDESQNEYIEPSPLAEILSPASWQLPTPQLTSSFKGSFTTRSINGQYTIHPLLENGNQLHARVTFYSTKEDISHQLSSDYLNQPAIIPPASFVIIRSKELPWGFRITARGSFVTVGEALEVLWNSLRKVVTEKELAREPLERQHLIREKAERRCRSLCQISGKDLRCFGDWAGKVNREDFLGKWSFQGFSINGVVNGVPELTLNWETSSI